MKRKNNIVLFILLVWAINVYSQQAQIQKDTFYFLTIVTWLDNGRPMTNFALIKSLNNLSELDIDSQDKFVCDFYKSAIVSEDPTIVLDKYLVRYKDSADIFREDIGKGLLKINKSEKKIFVHLKDNKSITLYISKIYASFWEYPISEKPDINHSFAVKCYNKNYFLSLKKVDKCLRIKKSEIKNIEQKYR